MDNLAGVLNNSKKSTGKQPHSNKLTVDLTEEKFEESLIQSEQFISIAVEWDKNPKKLDNANQLKNQQIGTPEENLETTLEFHGQVVDQTENQGQVQSKVSSPNQNVEVHCDSGLLNNDESQSGDDGSETSSQQ